MTLINFKILSSAARRKVRHNIMNRILDSLNLSHSDKNKDAILITLEDVLEDGKWFI